MKISSSVNKDGRHSHVTKTALFVRFLVKICFFPISVKNGQIVGSHSKHSSTYSSALGQLGSSLFCIFTSFRRKPMDKEYSVRREQLTQALNCSCTSELNTWAFTINLIVNAPVFSSDVQLQFSA